MKNPVHHSILLLLALILVVQPADSSQKKKKTRRDSTRYTPAPARSAAAANYGTYNFSFRTAEGKSLQLADFGGKVVLVNLWTTPCVPCTVEAKGFADLYRKYKDKGFEILSIAVHASISDIHYFITSTGAAWPVGFGDDVLTIFGAYGLPDNYLFLPDGRLARHFPGYLKDSVLEPELTEALREIPRSR